MPPASGRAVDSDEHDAILMSLVESALALDAAERTAFLDQVRAQHPDLFDEVKERVAWEDRMGGFLREPVVIARPEVPEHPFSDGERVNDRFRIVRELGRGGMGVVYEAADEKLNRRIAIKCARREFQSRLTPEAKAALEVSHPNVCKLHELHTAQTTAGPVDFLTMEFVEGETLFSRIERDGPLPEKEARAIVLQICAGLAQAHRQGVVHGDIKSGNVILSRTAEGQPRAVLTDFGLATLIGDTPPQAGEAQGGTLAYMAPELLAGGRASMASDIYALGILFRSLLPGKTGELPSPWKRIVGRCTEAQPEKRFASVDEIISILAGRRAIARWALAGALLVIAILAAVLWRSREETGPPVRLVVLPVTVEGTAIPSANGIGADVADRLSGARRSFTVIGPQEALRQSIQTAEKARSVLGATHVLRTSLASHGSQIAASAEIVDAASGQPLRQLRGTYPAADTALIAKAWIATVTRAFGLRKGVPREPTTGPAYQDYVQGVALMRRDGQSADEALAHFARAAQLDPTSALPFAGMAEAQMQKFDHGEGRQWLDQAGDNIAKAKSINPDSVQVLLASGVYLQMRGQYEPAIAEYTRATQLEPRNDAAWLRLAVAYEGSNRATDAIQTYQKAIQTSPDYYAHYLSFGTFYLRRSQFQEAERLYRQAVIMFPGLPEAHMDLGLSLMQQGKFSEAEKTLLDSLHLRRTSQTLMNVGALYYEEGRYQEAVRLFEEALAVGPASAVRYMDLADGYRHLGRSKESIDAYRAGRRLAEEAVARDPRGANARALLALFAAQLGDGRNAEFELTQALALQPENALVTRNAAITYEVLHQRNKALDVLRSAPTFLLEELSRYPDTRGLSLDPSFRAMMPKTSNR
jgi:serine/threonine-protein kinase